MKKAGIAREKLHFVEGDDFEAGAGFGLAGAKNLPDFGGVGGGDFLSGILIAFAAFEDVHAAAGIGARFEHGDFLVAVFAQGIDFGKKMAGFARSHVADEQSEESSASQHNIVAPAERGTKLI